MEIILAVVLTFLASAVADNPSCTPKHIPLPMGTITASSVDDQFTPGDIHYRNCSDVPFIVAKTHIGWCPDPHDKSPRIQINLHKQMSVHGIVFQTIYTQCADKSHNYGLDGFMRTFDLQYVLPGDHGRNLVTYGQDLNALDETSAEKKFEFESPIVTDTFSLVPRDSNVWPCFRFKLYGCDADGMIILVWVPVPVILRVSVTRSITGTGTQANDLCPSDFCLNGGTCSGKNYCSCPRGFYGNQCNKTVSDVTIYNYGFDSIENNTLKTRDADFLVNEFVTLVQDKKRDHHHDHHHDRPGQSCHFHGNHHGHHGHCEYHHDHHHDDHHHDNHHHGHHGMSNTGPHSHCMANLHSGHHGFTTSMNVNMGQTHHTHGHTYIYSNGGNIAGHNGASLSYHNNQLHFHISTDTHHWYATHPCTLLTGLWNTITTSWHPHQGAQIHINNNHVASCTHPKPNPNPCTNQLNLRLGDGHVSADANVNVNVDLKLNFDLKIQGLLSAALSSVQLSNVGINTSGAFTTPAPTTTSTTTTTTTTTPKPTTRPPVTATSTHQATASTTTGPYTPICYSYTNEASVGASTNSQKCAVGEVCSLFEDKHGYTAKCLSKTLCDAGKRLAGGQCWECCDSYLCNDQCKSVKSTCQDDPNCQVMMATGYAVCKDPVMSVSLCSKTCNVCSP